MMQVLTAVKNRYLYKKVKKAREGWHPYLTLDNSKEALKYYEEVFGAQSITQVPLHSDFADDFGVEADKTSDWTVHSQFEVLGTTIMAADNFHKDRLSYSQPAVLIDLHTEDERAMTQAKEFWEKIVRSDRVTINTKFEKQFWGGTMGHITDEYGVCWLIHVHPCL
ncbi:VOC family protein [Lactococcus garvieae]|uniref:VOC family protein n=1 Tax=Lactococcus garvieae TaxID=1363 RepID=UPI001E4D0DCC|nr:glyoxalase/bleomycin resistance/extradiol dioxygenase family protein [Lactococcus garvieae]